MVPLTSATGSPEFVPAWRLEIELHDLGRTRTATLDYAARSTVDAQLAQLAQLARRGAALAGRLLEFRNESGEMLAIVASAYVSHTVRAL